MGKNKKKNADVVGAPIVANEALGNADLNAASPAKADGNKKNVKSGKNNGGRPGIFKRIGKSFKEMFSELKKINWADKKSVFASTGIVIGVVILFLGVLMGINALLSFLLKLILNI